MAEKNKERTRVLPSMFAESTYLLDGRPFRLTNRHYLKAIYDSDIEEGMIMSGRQVEKSTTNSTNMSNYTLLLPNFKGLYFAPLTSQVKEFSNERIGKLYNFSQNDIVKKHYINKHDTQNVSFKQFTGDNINSTNYFKHCYGLGDNIRGITVNGIWGDEIQDIHIDAIPVIKECQAHAMDAGARMKITWYTGTPKTFSNTIQQYWDKSTQNEWIIKCPHCGSYQLLGVKNLEPHAFVCRKCRMEIPKANIINGFWSAMQRGKTLHGFRISQLMVPWITAEDIWYKYTNYGPDKFNNEVLGRSYENAEKPFNPLLLAQMCNNNFTLYNRAENLFANKATFMGVDWGTGEKSFTVVSIFGFNDEGKFQMLYTKRYERGDELESEYQIRDIANLMQIFRVVLNVVDWGFGVVQFQRLRALFGDRVACCYYSFNQKDEKKYDPKQGRWVVNRTAVIGKYIKDCKKMQILWAGKDKDKFPWMFDHHLAELAEYRKSQNGKSEDLLYNHPEGQPDDGLHSCVYAYLASQLYKGGPSGGVKFASVYSNTY